MCQSTEKESKQELTSDGFEPRTVRRRRWRRVGARPLLHHRHLMTKVCQQQQRNSLDVSDNTHWIITGSVGYKQPTKQSHNASSVFNFQQFNFILVGIAVKTTFEFNGYLTTTVKFQFYYFFLIFIFFQLCCSLFLCWSSDSFHPNKYSLLVFFLVQ